METSVIKVLGMSCEHCKQAVESALSDLSGVEHAQVNLQENQVTVTYDAKKVSLDQMNHAIEDQGYDVEA